MKGSARLGGAVTRQLRHLNRVLAVDHANRSDGFWLIPAAVLVGTTLGFFVIGQITAAPLYVSLPNGIVIAFVMAGLAVACMSPGSDAPADDPPRGDDDSPVLGSPGGPWTVVAHLDPGSPGGPATDVDLAPTEEREPALAGRP